MIKKALITGITGQDGSYLAELLLAKGYEVHGIVRQSSSFNRGRIEHLYQDAQYANNLFLHYGDLTDPSNLARLIEKINPDEIYHLGGQSHVGISFDIPRYTTETIALSILSLLEAIRDTRIKTRFYQASSSEMFGNVQEIPQRETTPFYPCSPYGIAKVFAHWTAVNYRKAYDIFICNGILFNHESSRRGENFVTRKITMGIAEIFAGKKDKIYLGNLDAERDWGFAGDYVEAMWLMLQQNEPDDYVIATGEAHSVREFLEESFKIAGIEIESNGKKGISIMEEYYRKDTGDVVVKIKPEHFRPAEVNFLIGDASKARKKLGWKPKVRFQELVEMMVKSDLQNIRNKIK